MQETIMIVPPHAGKVSVEIQSLAIIVKQCHPSRLTNGISHLTDNVTQAIKVGAEQLHAASQQLPEQKVIVQHCVSRFED